MQLDHLVQEAHLIQENSKTYENCQGIKMTKHGKWGGGRRFRTVCGKYKKGLHGLYFPQHKCCNMPMEKDV
jgi:hypothetical protein